MDNKRYIDGHKLRQARLKRFPDESMASVANNRLGIRKQALSEYERGKHQPGGAILLEICNTYRVDLRDLEKTTDG